jgi:hypothetical protein
MAAVLINLGKPPTSGGMLWRRVKVRRELPFRLPVMSSSDKFPFQSRLPTRFDLPLDPISTAGFLNSCSFRVGTNDAVKLNVFFPSQWSNFRQVSVQVSSTTEN